MECVDDEGRTLGWIALLRLDTDWYESTRHELEVCTHWFQRVASSSSTITDFGKAPSGQSMNIFRAEHDPVEPIDDTGRVAIKV
jgi:hypothetical protein